MLGLTLHETEGECEEVSLSVQQEVGTRVAEQAEVPVEALVKAPQVALADPGIVTLHLGAVVERDAGRDGGVGHKVLNPSPFQDVGGVPVQCFMVAHDVVGNVTWGAELHVRHPVYNMLPKLMIESLLARDVSKVANKVLKSQAWGLGA